MHIPNHIEALIFDLDGTLADTMPLHYKACQIVCLEQGFDFPLDFFIAKAGMPTISVFELLLKELNKDIDGAILGQAKEDKFLELVHEIKPIKLVDDLLVANKGKRKMAIGSGGQIHTIDLILKVINRTNDFESIVGCEHVSKHKPHPDTFLLAAEQMNIAPEKCLVLEDGDPGIEAAKAAGMEWIDVREHIGPVGYEPITN